jgi:putative ABC transport system permease protein
MFRYLPLAFKNSIRNRRRSILTISSIAVSLCLLGCLIAIYQALFYKDATPGQALRVIVRHRVSLAQSLPSSHEEKIRRVPGVKEISAWNWYGGTYKDSRDSKNFFARFGVEPKPFLAIRTQLEMPADQRQAFLTDRTACVVARDLSEKLNLKIGDRVTLVGDIYPVTLQLYVRGIFYDPDASNSLYFNEEYLRQALPLARRDSDSMFAILANSPDDVPRISKAVDEMFDNSPYPTKTESEQQFALSFVSFLGNVKLFLLSICGAVTFTILLVSGNTMAMSVRERIKEVGVLKTLGYTNNAILGIIMGEAASISLIGGIVGLILASFVTVSVGKVGATFNQQLNGLSVTPLVAAICLCIALFIGLVSSFIPAFNAARTNILDSLRYSG